MDFDLNSQAFREKVKFFKKKEHESLWASIYSFLSEKLTVLSDSQVFQSNLDENLNYDLIEETIKSIEHIPKFCSHYLELTKSRPLLYIETISLLHELLIPLNDQIENTFQFKNSISRLCETCWINNESGAENFLPQTIPFLLLNSLGPDSSQEEIQKVYQIRSAFILLDFHDPSIESVKALLLRCWISPLFLKSVDGRKFLAFILTILEGDVVDLVVGVMRPQILSGSQALASSYGDVLLRAWKLVSDPKSPSSLGLTTVEDVLQTFLHDCLHAANPKYHRGTRTMLHAFSSKRTKGLDSFILKVYGPILWRSLKCTNPLVRSQASCVLFDAFPLQNPSASAQEFDAVLDRQYDFFIVLLKDDDPRVRITAVSGICKLLREFWGAIPQHIKQQVLTLVVCSLVSDSSSTLVRLASVEGVSGLLAQPLAHPVLRGLLPMMKMSLNDCSEKVRSSFLDLLHEVKSIRDIHFCDIVPASNLFERLVLDVNRPRISLSICKLLCTSIFPSSEEFSSQDLIQHRISRCLELIEQHELAAICFFRHLPSLVSVGESSHFVCLLLRLLSNVPSFATKDEQGSTILEETLSKLQSRPMLQTSVLRIVFNCLDSLQTLLALDKHKESFDLIHSTLLSTFSSLFRIYSSRSDIIHEDCGLLLRSMSILCDILVDTDLNEKDPELSEKILTFLPIAPQFSHLILKISLFFGEKNTLLKHFSDIFRTSEVDSTSFSLWVELFGLMVEDQSPFFISLRKKLLSEKTFLSFLLDRLQFVLSTSSAFDLYSDQPARFFHFLCLMAAQDWLTSSNPFLFDGIFLALHPHFNPTTSDSLSSRSNELISILLVVLIDVSSFKPFNIHSSMSLSTFLNSLKAFSESNSPSLLRDKSLRLIQSCE